MEHNDDGDNLSQSTLDAAQAFGTWKQIVFGDSVQREFLQGGVESLTTAMASEYGIDIVRLHDYIDSKEKQASHWKYIDETKDMDQVDLGDPEAVLKAINLSGFLEHKSKKNNLYSSLESLLRRFSIEENYCSKALHFVILACMKNQKFALANEKIQELVL